MKNINVFEKLISDIEKKQEKKLPVNIDREFLSIISSIAVSEDYNELNADTPELCSPPADKIMIVP